MRLRTTLLIALCVAMAGGTYLFSNALRPPAEAGIIASFNQDRPVYEQLRNMVLSDDKLVRLADWGVETIDSPVVEIPPHGPFPVERFNKYLSLLTTIHAKAAARTGGANPEALFLVWNAGFAGDTRHVAICWLKVAPANQVDSLESFYRSPKPRHPAYKHIDGNWYIWADW